MTAGAWWRMLRKHGFRVRRRSLPYVVALSALTVVNSLVGLA